MNLVETSLELLRKDLILARAKACRLGFKDVVEALECAIKRLALAISRGGRPDAGDQLCLPVWRGPSRPPST